MPTALLDDRGLVRVSGVDARGFLQGLLTCDVEKIDRNSASYGALLTPQGKILFDFLLIAVPEKRDRFEPGYYFDLPRALTAEFVRRLSFYKLRAKVMIEDVSRPADYVPLSATARFFADVVAVWGGEKQLQAGAIDYQDPRDPRLGARTLIDQGEADALYQASDRPLYEAHRIALGIPKGGVDFAYGETFPHDADLDLLHGVDFGKGCYVGQEVVSRVEHRGTARKRILPVTFAGEAPAVGSEIRAGEQVVGTMGSSAQGHGLASFRVDRLQEAQEAGAKVMAGATELHPRLLANALPTTVS